MCPRIIPARAFQISMWLFDQIRARLSSLDSPKRTAVLGCLFSVFGSILYAPSNPLELLLLAMVVSVVFALLRGNPGAVTAGLILFIATDLTNMIGSELWPESFGCVALLGWCLSKAESRGTIRDVALLVIPVVLYLALPVYYSPVLWTSDCPSAGIQAGDLVLFEKSPAPGQDRIPPTCLGARQASPSGRPVVVLASDANPESLTPGLFRPSQIRWNRMFKPVRVRPDRIYQ